MSKSKSKRSTKSKRSVKRGLKSKTAFNKCASRKVRKVLEEYKKGKLKASDGSKVINRRRAVAIALSQATKSCRRKVDTKIIRLYTKEQLLRKFPRLGLSMSMSKAQMYRKIRSR